MERKFKPYYLFGLWFFTVSGGAILLILSLFGEANSFEFSDIFDGIQLFFVALGIGMVFSLPWLILMWVLYMALSYFSIHEAIIRLALLFPGVFGIWFTFYELDKQIAEEFTIYYAIVFAASVLFSSPKRKETKLTNNAESED